MSHGTSSDAPLPPPAYRAGAVASEDAILDTLEDLQHALCLPVEVWRLLVDALCPDSTEEPPPPPAPTRTVPGTLERVAVLQGRAERGEGLWHPGDLRADDPECDRLAILGALLRNGSESASRMAGKVRYQGGDGSVDVPAGSPPAIPDARVAAARARELIAHPYTTRGEERARLDDYRDALLAGGVRADAVARELGLDIRALRNGGGSFLRALLIWVRQQRESYLESLEGSAEAS